MYQDRESTEAANIAAAQSTHVAALAEAQNAAQAEIDSLRHQLEAADQEKTRASPRLEESLETARSEVETANRESEVRSEPLCRRFSYELIPGNHPT